MWPRHRPPAQPARTTQRAAVTTKTTLTATRGSRLPSPARERRSGDSGGCGSAPPGRAAEVYLRGPARPGRPSCSSRYSRPAGPRRRPPPGEAPRRSPGCGAPHMLRACRGPRRRTGGNPASGRWGDSLSSPALAVRFHSTLPGARRLPLLQQPRLLSARAPRRRGRLRSLRSWGCASCASPALQLAPRHPAAGAARSGPARHPLLAGHPDPLHPLPSPTPEMSRGKRLAHTLEWTGASVTDSPNS